MARAAAAEPSSAKTRIESVMAASIKTNPNQAIREQVRKLFDEALFSARNFDDALVVLYGRGIEAALIATPTRKRKSRAAQPPANGAQGAETQQTQRD